MRWRAFPTMTEVRKIEEENRRGWERRKVERKNGGKTKCETAERNVEMC